jgi:prevent-host-death family protein
MQVTIHAAKTNLSRLIEAALAGEEVVIARGKTPVARIVPIPQQRFKLGVLEGRGFGKGPDFLEPLTGDELAVWEGDSAP